MVLILYVVFRTGAGKFLEVQRIFPRIFANLPGKFLSDFAYKFSPTKIMKTFFWYDLQTKVFMWFQQTLGAVFEIKQRWAPFLTRYLVILPRFSGILPTFLTNQNFWCALAPLPSTPLFRTVTSKFF